MKFKDEYHPQVKKDLKRIDASVARDILGTHIEKILRNPVAGEALTGQFAGIRSYHFTKNKVAYRISYIVNPAERKVLVLMVGKRESFYKVLRRRL
ncbi:MAG: type II toxin-antitoxin system mRNA interferase toxin, RelE/StbE family [Spirochaetes bacterium]|nr:type II toxin-antitoxin system mRNA interferase toxin, RelE/StbE family [Spirochaetota bacterium]